MRKVSLLSLVLLLPACYSIRQLLNTRSVRGNMSWNVTEDEVRKFTLMMRDGGPKTEEEKTFYDDVEKRLYQRRPLTDQEKQDRADTKRFLELVSELKVKENCTPEKEKEFLEIANRLRQGKTTLTIVTMK